MHGCKCVRDGWRSMISEAALDRVSKDQVAAGMVRINGMTGLPTDQGVVYRQSSQGEGGGCMCCAE